MERVGADLYRRYRSLLSIFGSDSCKRTVYDLFIVVAIHQHVSDSDVGVGTWLGSEERRKTPLFLEARTHVFADNGIITIAITSPISIFTQFR